MQDGPSAMAKQGSTGIFLWTAVFLALIFTRFVNQLKILIKLIKLQAN